MLAVLLVVGLEFALVSLTHRAQFASVWELQMGIFGMLPTVVVGAALFGSVGAGCWRLLQAARAPWARRFLACLTLGFAGAVAFGVGGGRHLADLTARAGFAALIALASAAASYALAPRLALLVEQRPRLAGTATLVLVVMLELTNRFVLVRLYPAFHLGLTGLTLLLAPGLALLWLRPGPTPIPRRPWLHASITAGAIGLGALLAKPAAHAIAGFDNFRILMLEQGPLLSQVVELTAKLSPPPPSDPGDCSGEGTSCWGLVPEADAARGGIDLRERDLLLITVDALRADHVGVYGYQRPTTPHIDRLAGGGAVFLHAYAPTPHTSYSVTSLMTGKYMRPLLLQGAGQDSDTWAGILRTYGYHTAAFYPPAVFFIDPARFETFKKRGLDFEYRKVEFAEGDKRLAQVRDYLESNAAQQGKLFLWVHFFGPHEPYEQKPGFYFGERDVDRYDSEIAFVDSTIGKLVELVRKKRPHTAVVVTSDHGEEFGDHGGRYHGTTVYEEQVRVPMVIHAPGAVEAQRIPECVQTIDLLPTVLAALQVPRPPRMRGRNLAGLLRGGNPAGKGFAAAETEAQTLIAEGTHRLICERRIGACKLYDLESDPTERRDLAKAEPDLFEQLRKSQQKLSASHGRYETRGLRAEGKGWPAPILRGVTGDGDAAPEIAALLDDADVQIRRKAAELLFELGRPETAEALRLALSRAEDETVRRWCALALTRLGEGAPLVYELVKSDDQHWRRLAALALAESGDTRGADTLVLWWRDSASRDYHRSLQILQGLAKTHDKDAVWPLVQSLDDVRLRPHIARTLAALGDEFARGALVKALRNERYQSSRVALAEALVQLGAETDLAQPLVRFLGVPDPLPNGLHFALQAGIVESIGGPNKRSLERLQRESDLGVAVNVIVPRGGNGSGVRLLARARTRSDQPGSIYLGTRENLFRYNKKGEAVLIRDIPRLDASKSVRLDVPASKKFVEVHTPLPAGLGAKPGRGFYGVVFADHNVELEAVALVPLSDELPPPAPKPWRNGEQAQRTTEDNGP